MMPHSIILVGPPNSGKTTLYNCLTGYKARVVNYPGSTIDYLKGPALKKYHLSSKIVDTPGIYSLFPKNPGEKITVKILHELPDSPVVVTMDVFRVRRQLPLALQLKEAGFFVVIALTMGDLLAHPLNIEAFSKKIGIPVFSISAKMGKGISELIQGIQSIQKLKKAPSQSLKTGDPNILPFSKRIKKPSLQSDFFEKTDQAAALLSPQPLGAAQKTQKIDRVLLHPLFGAASFFAIMLTLFSSIFWLAAPAMDLVDMGFSFLAEKIGNQNKTLFTDFLSSGVITSFAAVFVFVPQIFILFSGIAVLEDSGYLARSASLMDALFSKIGLSGRSFIPFLSGYACAIPACLAARNITSRKERLIAIAVIPLLTCSARLPVYSLLLSLFFYYESPWKPGLWMAVIYISSMILAGVAASILNRLVQKKEERPPFVLELPSYKKPLLFGVLSSAWRRTKHYIKEAGPLIFMFALIMWGSTHFPRNLELDEAQQIEQSYAGRFGQKIEPAFELMGGDWRVGVGLLSAFVAREVFVSTLASLFQITQSESDETIKHSLLKKMRKAQNKRGDPVFSPLSIFVLILFFMISLQCLSTTAIVKKETGSSFFALAQLAILNIGAYVLCVGLYQLGQAVF